PSASCSSRRRAFHRAWWARRSGLRRSAGSFWGALSHPSSPARWPGSTGLRCRSGSQWPERLWYCSWPSSCGRPVQVDASWRSSHPPDPQSGTARRSRRLLLLGNPVEVSLEHPYLLQQRIDARAGRGIEDHHLLVLVGESRPWRQSLSVGITGPREVDVIGTDHLGQGQVFLAGRAARRQRLEMEGHIAAVTRPFRLRAVVVV